MVTHLLRDPVFWVCEPGDGFWVCNTESNVLDQQEERVCVEVNTLQEPDMRFVR